MDKYHIFANNLNAIRQSRNMSLAEFANELGIAKSTLQAVLAEGNTTLNTAVHISEGVNIPIDTLLEDGMLAQKLDIASYITSGLEWFESLSPETQKDITYHINKILEAAQNDYTVKHTEIDKNIRSPVPIGSNHKL